MENYNFKMAKVLLYVLFSKKRTCSSSFLAEQKQVL
jgi:hypothetical protein